MLDEVLKVLVRYGADAQAALWAAAGEIQATGSRDRALWAFSDA